MWSKLIQPDFQTLFLFLATAFVNFLIEYTQLFEKTVIRENITLGFDCADRINDIHSLLQHQKGNNQSGGSANPHLTVDKDFS